MSHRPEPIDAPRGRAYRGVPAEERSAQRRERLLRAALELFGTRGWNGTSVRALCTEAEVTTRHFYALFADREELFLALYEELTAAVHGAIAAAAAEVPASVDARARAALDAAVRAYAEDPRVARVVLIEVHGISQRVEERRQAKIAEAAELVERLFAGLAAGGRVPPLRAIALVGGVAEVLVHLAAHRRVVAPPAREEVVEELVALSLALARP